MVDKLDIDQYPDVHQELMPRPELLREREGKVTVNCLSLFLYRDYLQWGYIKADRDPKVFFGDVLRFHRLDLQKCLVDILDSHLASLYYDVIPNVKRLIYINTCFQNYIIKKGILKLPVPSQWKALVKFATKMDHSVREPLEVLQSKDPELQVVKARVVEDEEKAEEEQEEECQPLEEDEEKGYEPPSLTQYIAVKAVTPPTWDDETQSLNNKLKVEECEDNKDTPEKQALRRKIIKEIREFNSLDRCMELSKNKLPEVVVRSH
jgi:hypothetical protein